MDTSGYKLSLLTRSFTDNNLFNNEFYTYIATTVYKYYSKPFLRWSLYLRRYIRNLSIKLTDFQIPDYSLLIGEGRIIQEFPQKQYLLNIL